MAGSRVPFPLLDMRCAALATAEPNLPGANGLRRNLNVSGIGACKAQEGRALARKQGRHGDLRFAAESWSIMRPSTEPLFRHFDRIT
jgi:hypothetical protein